MRLPTIGETRLEGKSTGSRTVPSGGLYENWNSRRTSRHPRAQIARPSLPLREFSVKRSTYLRHPWSAGPWRAGQMEEFRERRSDTVSYTHLRAHETGRNLVCRLLLEKK